MAHAQGTQMLTGKERDTRHHRRQALRSLGRKHTRAHNHSRTQVRSRGHTRNRNRIRRRSNLHSNHNLDVCVCVCVCVCLVLLAQCSGAYCIYVSGCQSQESTERSSLSARRRLPCYRSRQHSHNLPVAVGTRGARCSTAPVFVQSFKGMNSCTFMRFCLLRGIPHGLRQTRFGAVPAAAAAHTGMQTPSG